VLPFFDFDNEAENNVGPVSAPPGSKPRKLYPLCDGPFGEPSNAAMPRAADDAKSKTIACGFFSKSFRA
jgi:hypothetical protein